MMSAFFPSRQAYEAPVEKGHGRVETRAIEVLEINDESRAGRFRGFDSVQQIARVTRTRWTPHKGETTEVHYAITSLPRERADAKKLLEIIREHWAIENNLHRTRDTSFNEDRSIIRKGSAPQANAALNNLAYFIIRQLGMTITHAMETMADNKYRATQLMRERIL